MKIEAKMKGERDMITGIVRLGFNHLFEKAPEDSEIRPGLYDASIPIDKSDDATIECVKKCVNSAIAKGVKETWGGKKPVKLRTPMRDGDNDESSNGTPVNEGPYADIYRNKYFMSPWSKSKPGIVDKHGAKIIDPDEVYAGCYVLVSLSFFPYKKGANCGVGVVINNLLKVKDGEPLAGKPTAESDFQGYDFDDDEDDII